MAKVETVWKLLDRVVREPIRDINNEVFNKQFEIVDGVPYELDESDKDTYSSNSDTKLDVDSAILRKIKTRKINILEREGD